MLPKVGSGSREGGGYGEAEVHAKAEGAGGAQRLGGREDAGTDRQSVRGAPELGWALEAQLHRADAGDLRREVDSNYRSYASPARFN